MAQTLILALQLADIEYQTGHKRPKLKMFFEVFYFKHLFVLLFKLVSIIEPVSYTHLTLPTIYSV